MGKFTFALFLLLLAVVAPATFFCEPIEEDAYKIGNDDEGANASYIDSDLRPAVTTSSESNGCSVWDGDEPCGGVLHTTLLY